MGALSAYSSVNGTGPRASRQDQMQTKGLIQKWECFVTGEVLIIIFAGL